MMHGRKNIKSFTRQFDDLKVSSTLHTRTVVINVLSCIANNNQHTLHNNPQALRPHTAVETSNLAFISLLDLTFVSKEIFF